MPKYDYICREHGVSERHVPYEQRDQQVCDCGQALARLPHYTTLQIKIPEAFRNSNAIGYTQATIEAQTDLEGSIPKHGGRWV